MLVGLNILLAIAAAFVVFPTPIWAGEDAVARDQFFKSLVFGHIGIVGDKKVAILTVPVRKKFWEGPEGKELWQERENAREAWVQRAATIWFDKKAEEWKKQVNQDFLTTQAGLQIGDIFHLRTVRGQMTATITGLDIDISDMEGPASVGPEFIAIAKLDHDNGEAAGTPVIGTRQLVPCAIPCRGKLNSPEKGMGARVSSVAYHACGFRPHPSGDVNVFEGHFSDRTKRQFLAYIMGITPDNIGLEKRFPDSPHMFLSSCTVVINEDLTSLAVLLNEPGSKLTPDTVIDINGDGLDEIWAVLSPIVGDSAPVKEIFYWRGAKGNEKFAYVYDNPWAMETSGPHDVKQVEHATR